jgi:hypothetical protein
MLSDSFISINKFEKKTLNHISFLENHADLTSALFFVHDLNTSLPLINSFTNALWGPFGVNVKPLLAYSLLED